MDFTSFHVSLVPHLFFDRLHCAYMCSPISLSDNLFECTTVPVLKGSVWLSRTICLVCGSCGGRLRCHSYDIFSLLMRVDMMKEGAHASLLAVVHITFAPEPWVYFLFCVLPVSCINPACSASGKAIVHYRAYSQL